jgi:hypothetical protein
MSRVVAEVIAPKDIRVSITLTMTIAEWDEIASALPEKWPCWQVASDIRDAYREIRQTVVKTSDMPLAEREKGGA